jgi:hypothetical protein
MGWCEGRCRQLELTTRCVGVLTLAKSPSVQVPKDESKVNCLTAASIGDSSPFVDSNLAGLTNCLICVVCLSKFVVPQPFGKWFLEDQHPDDQFRLIGSRWLDDLVCFFSSSYLTGKAHVVDITSQRKRSCTFFRPSQRRQCNITLPFLNKNKCFEFVQPASKRHPVR